MKSQAALLIAGVFLVAGLACLIAGIVLITKSTGREENAKGNAAETSERCGYSQEAERVGLETFIRKVQDKYFELHPYKIASRPGVKAAEIRQKFHSYDPSAENLKRVSDEASKLYKEVTSLALTVSELKPREKKALAQVKHFLKHDFATPFDGDYYGGDFLLGPNIFCYQAICGVGTALGGALGAFKPSNLEDVRALTERLAEVKATFDRYTENLRYGVRAGMVRCVEQCEAGLHAIKGRYQAISRHGAKGVFDESYMKDLFSSEFLSNLAPAQLDQWNATNGKALNESIRDAVLEYVGKPIHDFLRFLETENMQHCVPSSVSSGLATLPLSFVYLNGTANATQRTTKTLRTGEPLNGTRAYLKMLSFFTTTEATPDEVYKLGQEMLQKLYPEAQAVARNVTRKTNDSEAVEEFKSKINASDQYYNDGNIPSNESGANAHSICRTLEGAEKNCPQRMKAIKAWFTETRQVMSLMSPKTVNMFHFTGAKQTTPSCPLELVINFDPQMGVPSYRGSNRRCTRSAHYYVPFFLDRPGPRYMQWSTNAHEGVPGHHTQVQGLTEHFQDTCGGVIGWLSGSTFYTAFAEGWALYAENPLIAYDTDVYKHEPLYKYGMLKSQAWRAVRLIIDTGLHAKNLSRSDAIKLFMDKLWDDGDVVRKEVTRYQSVPGQATSYMIGQLQILKLRKRAEKELGKAFNLKDFHLHLLYQGSAPLSYLEQSIGEYIECAKHKEKAECRDVLNPPPADSGGDGGQQLEQEANTFYY